MRITNIERISHGDETSIKARVLWDKKPSGMPDILWFETSTDFLDCDTNIANSFFVTLLPVAMFFNETLYVEGEISEELLYNSNEYQKTLVFWNPQLFNLIQVSSRESTVKQRSKFHRGIISTVTGGVDSLYTLHTHHSSSQPIEKLQVSHALFISDFDKLHTNHETERIKKATYKNLTHNLNLTFVSVATNAKEFYMFNNYYALQMTFSTIIVALAHLLEKDISKFHFSADYTYDFPILLTIHNHLLPLLTTENLKVYVDGASVHRLDKLKFLQTIPATYDVLTVCYSKPNGLLNCGECMKCIYTLAGLELLNMRNKYHTFPKVDIRKNIRQMPIQRREYNHYTKSWIKIAEQYHRRDLQIDFTILLWRNRVYQYVLFPLQQYTQLLPQQLFVFSAYLKGVLPVYARAVRWVKNT